MTPAERRALLARFEAAHDELAAIARQGWARARRGGLPLCARERALLAELDEIEWRLAGDALAARQAARKKRAPESAD